MLIIRDAFYGVQSFSELQRRRGIAKTLLADRLQSLVDHDILTHEPTRPKVD
ncbi:MAG: winged helix-turn-helix transcriptional regulator [Deltaproteobacteria bacterium]|nr:winged helix-turn-helix transcriptional regulator [Deltaproteobacteria bacterium]NND27201.1 hypothetical protein [Myxococcales bacterium]MBT8465393.1 winged helix-turn-helix transcriptional regulator [Deltaproteobacteria bacterium]MBT8482229.1 winged helix-turn-helix transcriptional regulator [Deltaproteobacteria bacterium]NNK06747.1 hypothetical protein [Myxococcales bacterium]